MSRDRKVSCFQYSNVCFTDQIYNIHAQRTGTLFNHLLRHFKSNFLSCFSSVETVITVNKPNCTSLPQECSEQPHTELREVKCTCPTVECKWNAWSAWSATCGAASRTRTIKTIKVRIELSVSLGEKI